MNEKLNLLHELAAWLKPTTLADIIASLNSGEDRITHNMGITIGVFADQLEALVGSESGAMIYDASIELEV